MYEKVYFISSHNYEILTGLETQNCLFVFIAFIR